MFFGQFLAHVRILPFQLLRMDRGDLFGLKVNGFIRIDGGANTFATNLTASEAVLRSDILVIPVLQLAEMGFAFTATTLLPTQCLVFRDGDDRRVEVGGTLIEVQRTGCKSGMALTWCW